MTPTVFQSLAARIQAAASLADLAAREAQCTRHYQAGTITAQELAKLDSLCSKKYASLTP